MSAYLWPVLNNGDNKQSQVKSNKQDKHSVMAYYNKNIWIHIVP